MSDEDEKGLRLTIERLTALGDAMFDAARGVLDEDDWRKDAEVEHWLNEACAKWEAR